MLAENVLRSSFNAIAGLAAVADAEVAAVQVSGKDLFLAVIILDAEGQDHFLDLTLIGLFITVLHDQTCQLLGDRAPTLDNAASFYIGDHGTGDTDRVDPMVVVETLVFQ